MGDVDHSQRTKDRTRMNDWLLGREGGVVGGGRVKDASKGVPVGWLGGSSKEELEISTTRSFHSHPFFPPTEIS